ncbi:MAG: FMN-binding protein [Bacillota bacterium]
MKFLKAFVSLLILLTLLLVAVGCDSAPSGENGEEVVVQGEAHGYNDEVPIEVEVTVVNDEITDIEIIGHEESEDVCEPALEEIPARIIDNQSTDVDAVSAATETSKGIMKAVENALESIE